MHPLRGDIAVRQLAGESPLNVLQRLCRSVNLPLSSAPPLNREALVPFCRSGGDGPPGELWERNLEQSCHIRPGEQLIGVRHLLEDVTQRFFYLSRIQLEMPIIDLKITSNIR